ncbi:MAG: addiction module toxin, HicA family [Nitrospirae bacterium]|nr:addiction module toxin, HicA family [Nitrospirota bacterium]
MTRKDRLLKKFLKNPDSLKFNEIEKLLLHFGYRRVRINGSHYRYRHRLSRDLLTFPVHHNNCKRKYKIELVKLIINKLL